MPRKTSKQTKGPRPIRSGRNAVKRTPKADVSITRRTINEPVWIWVLIAALIMFIVWYIWAWLTPSAPYVG